MPAADNSGAGDTPEIADSRVQRSISALNAMTMTSGHCAVAERRPGAEHNRDLHNDDAQIKAADNAPDRVARGRGRGARKRHVQPSRERIDEGGIEPTGQHVNDAGRATSSSGPRRPTR